MVVSERYACFWSLFNLRFSLYSAQFIMLTLFFKFNSFTFTTNLDFSLLFNPHLLWFLYLFSVVLFFPPFLISLWGVKLFFVCPVWKSGAADSDLVQEHRGHKAVLLLVNVKMDLGREMTGLMKYRHECEQQLLPLAGMAATQSHCCYNPYCSPLHVMGWMFLRHQGTPAKEKKAVVWWAGVGADSVMLWKELVWLLRFPLPCFFF